MEKKLFRNCPEEIIEQLSSEYEGDCRNCPGLTECLQSKIQDVIDKQRLKQKIKMLIILNVGIILLCIVFLIVSLNTNTASVVVINEITTGIVVDDKEETKKSTKEKFEYTVIEEELEKEPIVISVPELSAYAPSECYYYDISYEDKIVMAKVVYEEARGEIFEGKVAVAAVILNRFYSGFPEFDTESICAVVSQGTQFADISDTTLEELESVPECMEAVEAACKGWDPTREMFPEGAKHFYAPKGDIEPYQRAIRQNIQELTIGNHNFHNEFNLKAGENFLDK